jgi:hypothetical protein
LVSAQEDEPPPPVRERRVIEERREEVPPARERRVIEERRIEERRTAEPPPEPRDRDPDDNDRKTLSFGLRLGVWMVFLDASVRVPRGSLFGTKVDFHDDFDSDDHLFAPAGEIFLTSEFVQLYVDGFVFGDDDKVTLDSNFTFDGEDFQQNQRVDIETLVTSAGARVHITPIALDVIELGVVLGGRYFRFDTDISARSNDEEGRDIDAGDTLEIAVPFIGLSARFFLGPLEIYGWAVGLDSDFDFGGRDLDIKYVEAEAGLAINLGQHFAIFAGFRVLYLDVVEEKNDREDFDFERTEYDLNMVGPVFGIRVRF